MTDRNESRPRSAGMPYIFDLHVLPVKPQPGVATISHHVFNRPEETFMIDKNPDDLTAREFQAISVAIAENRGWFIALGVVLIILGVISIGAPHLTTVAAKIFIGWLFLIAGISLIVHAFLAQGWKAFLGELVIGLLYAVIGGWLAFFPLTGIIGLTVLLAATFIVDGVFKFSMGLQVKPEDGWIWLIFSGVIAIIAGLLIFLGLPSTANWALGLIVGLNLLMSGVAFLMVAIAS